MNGQLGLVRRPAIVRFNEKVAAGENGCVVWAGGLNGAGYGQFYIGRTSYDQTGKGYAHRWAYEHFVGPIPDGLVIDHLCRNRRCVNPYHLDPVTQRENLMRGDSPSSEFAITLFCPAGHMYDARNTYTHPHKGYRACRTCGRERARARAQAKRKSHIGKKVS